jgi:hypothetical protein
MVLHLPGRLPPPLGDGEEGRVQAGNCVARVLNLEGMPGAINKNLLILRNSAIQTMLFIGTDFFGGIDPEENDQRWK